MQSAPLFVPIVTLQHDLHHTRQKQGMCKIKMQTAILSASSAPDL